VGDPAVSVIIPFYNAQRFLSEAVESVLAQAYRPIEVLLVDDGSTDGSAEIAKGYGGAARYIHLPHSGLPSVVRNQGLQCASGELVAFLDADDTWRPGKLRAQVARLSRDPDVGMIHTNLDLVDVSGRILRPYFLECPGSQGLTDERAESSFEQLIMGDSGVRTSSVVLRRAVLDRVGFFPETLRIGEDWHLWIRVARHYRIVYLPERLASHRKHGDNIGLRWHPSNEAPGAQLWREILELYPDLAQTHTEVMRGKFVIHELLAGLRSLRARRYAHGFRSLAKALAANPFAISLREWRRNIGKLARLREAERAALEVGAAEGLN